MICTPRDSSASGVMALTVAEVPTGMKTGLSTLPRRVSIFPHRARPSVYSVLYLNDEHGIAIAEKPVLSLNSLFISLHDKIMPGKGTDQHQECRAWEMKVRDQGLDCLEGKPVIDEYVGGPITRSDLPLCVHEMLQHPGGRGTHSNDSPPLHHGLMDG